MQPKLTLLSDELITRILDEAHQLLLKPGVKVNNEEARDLLASAGAQVDSGTKLVRISQQIVRKNLGNAPPEILPYYYYSKTPTKDRRDDGPSLPGTSRNCLLKPETDHD